MELKIKKLELDLAKQQQMISQPIVEVPMPKYTPSEQITQINQLNGRANIPTIQQVIQSNSSLPRRMSPVLLASSISTEVIPCLDSNDENR